MPIDLSALSFLSIAEFLFQLRLIGFLLLFLLVFLLSTSIRSCLCFDADSRPNHIHNSIIFGIVLAFSALFSTCYNSVERNDFFLMILRFSLPFHRSFVVVLLTAQPRLFYLYFD